MPVQSLAELGPELINVLGLIVAGDVGDLTIYTNRHGKVVWYPRKDPEKEPSPAQLQQRARFAWAQANYKALPQATKAAWELLVRRAHLDLTGQNLFLSASLSPDPDKLNTLIRRTGVSVTLPPFATW